MVLYLMQLYAVPYKPEGFLTIAQRSAIHTQVRGCEGPPDLPMSKSLLEIQTTRTCAKAYHHMYE